MTMNLTILFIIDLPWLKAKSRMDDCTPPCQDVPLLFGVIGYDKRLFVGKRRRLMRVWGRRLVDRPLMWGWLKPMQPSRVLSVDHLTANNLQCTYLV